MISNLEREVRSLKEGFGPFPSMMPPSTQPESKTPKRLSTPEKRHEKERREKDILPSSQQQEECLDMEIEPLLNNTPGCSTNEEYMNRRMDWPQGGDSTPWSADAIGAKRDANININAKANPNAYSNIYTNTNTNVTRDKKFMVKTAELTKPYNKGIRLVENRQLVPPSHPSPRNSEWVNVTGKRRRKQSSTSNEAATGSRQRLASTRGVAAKPGRKLIKLAVVTITNKSGDTTYAQILAKAREKVSFKDLGIETTVIRRAMNGAIVIEVPGPQGKQLAGTLSSRLAAALGEDAKVLNPVAMGKLRLRGIDPSTSTEEIYIELEALSGHDRTLR